MSVFIVLAITGFVVWYMVTSMIFPIRSRVQSSTRSAAFMTVVVQALVLPFIPRLAQETIEATLRYFGLLPPASHSNTE